MKINSSVNNFIVLSIIILGLFSIFLIFNVKAETFIYDNISTVNNKCLEIYIDKSNNFLNSYNYPVYINDYYYKDIKLQEKICIDDNSTIIIDILDTTNANNENIWNKDIKPFISSSFGIIISSGIMILILAIVIIKIYKLKRGK